MPQKKELETKDAAAAVEPMDAAEAGAFLVRLANVDVKGLRPLARLGLGHGGDPGELPSLLYGLRRYLWVEGRGRINTELRAAEKDPSQLEHLIEDVRKLLTAVARRDYARTRFHIEAPFDVMLKEPTPGAPPESYTDQSLRDAVLLSAIVDDLGDSDIWKRIRLCKRCERIFYARTLKQLSCSHRCASAAAVASFRQAHPKKRKASQRTTVSQKPEGNEHNG